MKAKYNEYKASDIPWVNEIPSHWKITKAKRLWKKEQRRVRPEDDIVTAFRDGTVTLRKNRREDGFTISLKEIGYQGVRKDDLVIHQMDAFAGAIGVSDSDGKCTPVYSVCTPIGDANPHYYNFLLREMSRSKFIVSLAKGIRERSSDFRFNMFGDLEVPVPPKFEQKVIADFIYNKTLKVKEFISKKKTIISLLNEQKLVVINQAVTKGLNPYADKKDSRIEGLGMIPNQWNISKLKYLTSKIGDGLHATPNYVDSSDIFFINGTNLKNSKITLTSGTRCVSEEEYLKYRIPLKTGAILLSLNGTIGNLAYYNSEKVILGKSAAFIECKDELYNKYVYYYLQSEYVKNYFNDSFSGTTINNLSLYTLRNTPIIVPPKQDQIAIVSFIEHRLHELDKTISAIKKEILLTEEYLKTLIAEAVTGKIDVRNYALENRLEPVES